MCRETAKKVKAVVNSHYTTMIYNQETDHLLNLLRESGVLSVAGQTTYYQKLRNMKTVRGETDDAIMVELFAILFTRENWWIPFIKALRQCGAIEKAKIIEAVLPKSEKQKLEESPNRESSPEGEYPASEASTDIHDSGSEHDPNDISIDEEEQVNDAQDGHAATSTESPTESLESPVGPDERAGTVGSGAISSVKNGLKTMFRLIEWVSVSTDTNGFYKWYST